MAPVCDVARYYRDNYDNNYRVEVTYCIDSETGAEEFRLIKVSGLVAASYAPLSEFNALHPLIAAMPWVYLGTDQGYSLYQKLWSVTCQEGEVNEPTECWDGSFINTQICQDGLWTNYESCPQEFPTDTTTLLIIGGVAAAAIVAGVFMFGRK